MAVLGAGIVGVTTAYELVRDGHEVVVVDRRLEPASEASFANAGMIAPGHSFAWSSPHALGVLLGSLWRNDSALKVRFQRDPHFWRWAFRFVGQCTRLKAKANTRHKVALSIYSQGELHRVIEETAADFGARSEGAIYLYRTIEGFARGAANALHLRECGASIFPISVEQAAKIDPIWGPVADRFKGALYAQGDESGDARLFTLHLAEFCRHLDVEFRMNEPITAIRTEGDRVTAVVTSQSEICADAYVLALGSYSATMGRTVGLDLPVYPVKGYSLTIPIVAGSRPPILPGVDESNLLAFANYGDRVRFTAVAEFAGYDWSHRPTDFRNIFKVGRDLFPDAGDWEAPSYWAGLRPMTPDNLPILGHGRLVNLFVNTGHGHMGWTWACGTARITADLLCGRVADFDPAPMLLH